MAIAQAARQNRRMQGFHLHTSAVLSLALACSAVAAQAIKVPPPSRTVYKCTTGGKTVYSDSPCLGAQRMEIEPTRGMDSMTGARRVGADVRREHHREAVAEAIKPLTGKDAKGIEKDHRRFRLTPDAQRACAQLDRDLPMHERAEREVQPADLPNVQQSLLSSRQRYRDLGC